MTKHCQMSVAAAQDWDTPSPLDRYRIVELEFWKDSLRRLNSRDLFSCNPPFISVYSDASDVPCGGYILGKDIFAHRMFTNTEQTQSSTYRELAAILFVLNALRPFLSSSRVKWFTDNQGAARIVQVGSMHAFRAAFISFGHFLLLLQPRYQFRDRLSPALPKLQSRQS